MPETDLDAIGRNCQFAYCNQLDFLPFRCESCGGTFCLDHRTENAHRCVKEGEWARRREGANQPTGNTAAGGATEKPNIYNADQCAHVSCKTLVNTLKHPGVRCPECRRVYCLQHRLKEEHECAKIAAGRTGRSAGGGRQTGNETLKSMFAKVKGWKGGLQGSGSGPGSKKPTGTSGGTGGISAVNNLKRTAKGDQSIPSEKRVYLHVVGTSDTQSEKTDPPNGAFFYDVRWKVGRVLDDAAKKLAVENLNNRGGGEEKRLRLFHVEAGEFLEFSSAISNGGKVRDGHTIVLLRGAGVVLGK